jgi:hypothetical protein
MHGYNTRSAAAGRGGGFGRGGNLGRGSGIRNLFTSFTSAINGTPVQNFPVDQSVGPATPTNAGLSNQQPLQSSNVQYQPTRTTYSDPVVVETVESGSTSPTTDRTGQQDTAIPYTTLFPDTFNLAELLRPSTGDQGIPTNANDATEIDFMSPDASNGTNTNDNVDEQRSIGAIRLIFEMFGESLTDADVG